ncbi:fumarylacetoacetate hydrolase family protein [Neptunomonas phycophila]|jgi:2-keto-4-pentenoate hydratase|uniref:fumarylacetoacetate hydrolase family protein n=1 Tax=Neptunomonas phycophila TaxID=1572645 RepID=UPI0037363A52
MSKNVQKLADALVMAQQTGQVVNYQQACELTPASDEEAYQVQALVAEKLGWFASEERFIWKTGGTLQNPSAARVRHEALVYATEKEGEGHVRHVLHERNAHDFTSIEIEVAITLARSIKSDSSIEALEAAIDNVYLSVEVCDQRVERWADLPASIRLADQQMNRAIILVGKPTKGWRDSFVNPYMSITVNQQAIALGEGTHPLGHPLALLPWLNSLSETLYSRGLEAGDTVTTGTWFGLQVLAGGDEVVASIDGLGEVRLSLEP